jgi:hypothetical protein
MNKIKRDYIIHSIFIRQRFDRLSGHHQAYILYNLFYKEKIWKTKTRITFLTCVQKLTNQ